MHQLLFFLKKQQLALLSALMSFVLSLFGNLLAGWLQQLHNVFTLPSIIAIIIFTIIGLFLGEWLRVQSSSPNASNPIARQKTVVLASSSVTGGNPQQLSSLPWYKTPGIPRDIIAGALSTIVIILLSVAVYVLLLRFGNATTFFLTICGILLFLPLLVGLVAALFSRRKGRRAIFPGIMGGMSLFIVGSIFVLSLISKLPKEINPGTLGDAIILIALLLLCIIPSFMGAAIYAGIATKG